jgi:hypothetical protein
MLVPAKAPDDEGVNDDDAATGGHEQDGDDGERVQHGTSLRQEPRPHEIAASGAVPLHTTALIGAVLIARNSRQLRHCER